MGAVAYFLSVWFCFALFFLQINIDNILRTLFGRKLLVLYFRLYAFCITFGPRLLSLRLYKYFVGLGTIWLCVLL